MTDGGRRVEDEAGRGHSESWARKRGGILASRRESILGSAAFIRRGTLFEGVSHTCHLGRQDSRNCKTGIFYD